MKSGRVCLRVAARHAESNDMKAFKTIAEHVPAPIGRHTIDEKVETFERRMNGKILPFLGLHGSLITLVYIFEETDIPDWIAAVSPWLSGFVLLAIALLFGLLTGFYQRFGKARDISGGGAIAFSLAIVAVLSLPIDQVGLVLAAAIHLLLLVLNATSQIDDYEINTVWIYLPAFFFLIAHPSGEEQLLLAVALYGPAIYVKFFRQPGVNKVPLGFSILIYLFLAIKDNAESEALISAMVLAVLVLFIYHSYRMRRLAGSSYRHFLFDAILVGLWGLLVYLVPDVDDDDKIVAWGIGVAAYQGIQIYLRFVGRQPSTRLMEERGARLSWLQIGAVAIFGQFIVEEIMERLFGFDALYATILLIVAFFVPVYRLLQSAFLALTTRLWVAGCLVAAVIQTKKRFEWEFLVESNAETPEALRGLFLAGHVNDLILVVFALLVGLASTFRIQPEPSLAWWRGMVRARHMALVRRGVRLVIANANRIAFVGGIISAIAAMVNWMRYAGSDRGGLHSRDLILVGVHVYAVAISVLLARYWVGCCDLRTFPELEANPLVFATGDLPYVLACCTWGVALYLNGVILKDYLARFFATAFVVMPLLTYGINNSPDDASFLALVGLICCFSLVCFGLLRRIAG